jgi:hypothetical protein
MPTLGSWSWPWQLRVLLQSLVLLVYSLAAADQVSCYVSKLQPQPPAARVYPPITSAIGQQLSELTRRGRLPYMPQHRLCGACRLRLQCLRTPVGSNLGESWGKVSGVHCSSPVSSGPSGVCHILLVRDERARTPPRITVDPGTNPTNASTIFQQESTNPPTCRSSLATCTPPLAAASASSAALCGAAASCRGGATARAAAGDSARGAGRGARR